MPPDVLPWSTNPIGPPPGQYQGQITVSPGGNVYQYNGRGWVGQKQTVTMAQGGQTYATFAVSNPIFVCPNDGSQWVLDQPLSVFVNAASTSGTVKAEVAGSGVTVGSGTDQQGTTIALNAITHATVNGSSILANPTVMTAGATLNLIFAGTLTNLTGCTITAVLRRVDVS